MTRLWPDGEPIAAWGGEEQPAGFQWQGEDHRIEEVCACWRVHTRWWQQDETIWREYHKVTTDTGLLCLLYRDLLQDRWFLSRVYD